MTAFTGRVAAAPRVPWRTILALALLVLALAATAVMVGSLQPRLPGLVGPAGNGLIAFADPSADIYVGDPIAGVATRIVTSLEFDSRPVFSPDGTRIAFVSSRLSDVDVVVVRPDGSDKRVITRSGFDVGYFAWTLDSDSIVVGNGSGKLFVFDAARAADPSVLTPPLASWRGAGYFDPNAQVAPMFRPPTGDRILDFRSTSISAMNPDGSGIQVLVDWSDGEYRDPSWPAWSPDASKIAFSGTARGSDDGKPRWIFIMNADGSDLRRVGLGWSPAWSPDSSMIAVERWSSTHCPLPSCGPDDSWIAIVDVETGAERELEATMSREAVDGWTWSPDGRSLLVLRDSGTRLITVDPATGVATELPWEAGSGPSWQRLPAD